jgi:hypothetical protein
MNRSSFTTDHAREKVAFWSETVKLAVPVGRDAQGKPLLPKE